MLFNSHEFLWFFLPLTLLGYVVLGRIGSRAPIVWLVLASLFFYGWWNPSYLLLIGTSIFANFSLGQLLRRFCALGKAHSVHMLLVVGVALNLGLIGYFKYAGFLLDTTEALTGASLPALDILLPIGISFFTFQQIAYLVDASRGVAPRATFPQYCFFITFFPQLIAGPIVHLNDIHPQFRRMRTNYRALWPNLAMGLSIFIIGLFKKVVIADEMAPIANATFAAAAAGDTLDAAVAWRGTFAYSLQIYFDFSGYSDMAIGLARMFGFRLPINFDSPYKATSIVDFWRRWHITLSRFLRDYLYIPLGGNRRGRLRRHVNLLVTMLLGGLWHGASWTFVIWGGLHGAYLLVNHALRRGGVPGAGAWWRTLLGRAGTFLAVSVAWVFFRAASLDEATVVLRGMTRLPEELATGVPPLGAMLGALGFGFDGSWSAGDTRYALWLLGWLAFIWYAPNTQQYVGYLGVSGRCVRTSRSARSLWRPSVLHAIALGTMFAVAIIGLSRVSEFIYFQF